MLVCCTLTFECLPLLTAVKVALSQLDDGVILAQNTTPVYSVSKAWLQHRQGEKVWTLGHLQFASIHVLLQACLVESEASAAVC